MTAVNMLRSAWSLELCCIVMGESIGEEKIQRKEKNVGRMSGWTYWRSFGYGKKGEEKGGLECASCDRW